MGLTMQERHRTIAETLAASELRTSMKRPQFSTNWLH